MSGNDRLSDPLHVRVMLAARENGIRLRPDGTEEAPDTLAELVADFINLEWVATDRETGETARGESPSAAWANLRGISKMDVHDRIVAWHADRWDTHPLDAPNE